MFRRILVGIDGSKHSARALDVAGDLARMYGSEVLVLHVLDQLPPRDIAVELARDEHVPLAEEEARYAGGLAHGDLLARAAADGLRAKGVRQLRPCVAEGRPAKEILKLAKQEDVDLIVLGSRGLGDIGSLLLGGLSHKVVHLADRPCLIVP